MNTDGKLKNVVTIMPVTLSAVRRVARALREEGAIGDFSRRNMAILKPESLTGRA